MKKVLILFLLPLVLFSCKKDKDCTVPDQSTDYLVFGYASCFCLDCCKTGYKIADEALYKGERNTNGIFLFEANPVEVSKYELAKVLRDEFPAELLAENGKLFGCGGCADQPVYYVEMKKGGVMYHWQIDSQTDGFPDYVKIYSVKLGDVLTGLQ